MVSQLEQLLSAYERGVVTRRQLIQALVAIAVPAAAAAQAPAPPVKHPYINHLQIIVSDLKRSADFYKRMLGAIEGKMYSVGAKDNVQSLPFPGDGSHWLSIRLPNAATTARTVRTNEVGHVDHFSFAVEDWDVPRILDALKKAGVPAETTGSTGAIWMRDPDGFNFQLMDKNARE